MFIEHTDTDVYTDIKFYVQFHITCYTPQSTACPDLIHKNTVLRFSALSKGNEDRPQFGKAITLFLLFFSLQHTNP